MIFPRIDGQVDKVYIEKKEVSERERDAVMRSSSRLMRKPPPIVKTNFGLI